VEFQMVSISLCLCRYFLLVSTDDDNTEGVRKLRLLSPFIDPVLGLFRISRICLQCSLKVFDQSSF
jgi:hypothetical protein